MGETSSNDPGSHGRGNRQACVLVVEDDPALQRMILDYFVENNIRTLVASDRREMVSKLGCIEVNLVILDLRVRRTVWICYGRFGRVPTCRLSSLPVTAATTSIGSSGSSSAPTIM